MSILAKVGGLFVSGGGRRGRVVAALFVLQLALWTILRGFLVARFAPSGHGAEAALALPVGLVTDLCMAGVYLLPWGVGALLWRRRWSTSKIGRGVFRAALFLWCFTQVFLLFTEYYFFDEFNARFNTVAVDYLIYPQEVFINIKDSYPLFSILSVCLAAGLLLSWLLARWALAGTATEAPLQGRLKAFAVGFAVSLVLALSPIPKIAHYSEERVVGELASNGPYCFVWAAYTHNLDYVSFYKTLPLDEAYQRTRRVLGGDPVRWDGSAHSIRRTVAGDAKKAKLNVVIVLEESFGSEFWGVLGAKDQPSLTPEMDALSKEGLLFTHLYACGNRTVRGMEGVLSSFPPLPGDSIVKRPYSDHVETLGRLFKRDGYDTFFLYGGRGLFDGMKSFAVRNGYDRFIEQKDFDHPTFTTIWGVCDEDLFHRGIEEMRALHATGRPFFATLLTVSNHKPYLYPEGRVAADPKEKKRRNAVMYTDWALGDFFRRAKKEAFWKDTIFVVIADHGARVYGSAAIPIHSYEIPLVVLGPAVGQPRHVDTVGNSLDVGPTVLGLIGRPYESVFFGRDILHDPVEGGRALLNHNRDIGMFRSGLLSVLGLNRTSEFYRIVPETRDLTNDLKPGPEEEESLKDAEALFQVADDLYTHQRYNVETP